MSKTIAVDIDGITLSVYYSVDDSGIELGNIAVWMDCDCQDIGNLLSYETLNRIELEIQSNIDWNK